MNGRRRIPLLTKVAAVIVGVYLATWLIQPPLPHSVKVMYMTLTLCGILVYISIYPETWNEFSKPILEFFRGDPGKGAAWRGVRWAVLALIPLLIGMGAYRRVSPSLTPPAEQRTVHPAPPFEVMGMANPLREHPERLKEQLALGARVYFQNCVFCHGDRFDGQGHFAKGFNPPPANFTDPGTLAQLQESYVFWRVSTGGPGLPVESTPWNSAMPRWETMLSEKERWAAVLYLYHKTGWKPRTWE